jgi:hypothetical protein
VDSFALAQALCSSAVLRDIPIIAVTSYALPDNREEVLATGSPFWGEKKRA